MARNRRQKSIDDITPEEWNEINRKHLAESDVLYDPPPAHSSYDNPPETLSRLGLGVDPIEYRYNEGDTIDELKQYIDSTYDQHYSKNKFQATEFIIDGGHGEGFCIGNIMKYAQRYGNKDGYNKKDLMKVLHYAIIMLYVHDHLGRD